MQNHVSVEPDYGTGKKKLSVYIMGLTLCVILTIIAFWVVMKDSLPETLMFAIVFPAALIQFFVQVGCFLRLNVETEQGKMNMAALVFSIVILIVIIGGSAWIMWNLHYNMMH